MQDSASPPRSGDHIEYARLLRQVDLFAGLDRVTLAKLASHLRPQSYAAGSIIFRQGDVGDAFFLVASGTVGVHTTGKTWANDIQVRVLQAGEPFGEMALLSNIPRTATIKVETDCQVLRLDRSAFLELVREQPSVALAVAATLSRRLAGMLDRVGAENSESGVLAEPRIDEPTLDKDSGQAATLKAPVAATAARLRWRIDRIGISLLLAIVILVMGWTLPPPAGFTVAAWHMLAVLLAVTPALVLDAVLEGVLALLLACGLVLFGVASTAEALSGFASTSWVLVVSVLIIGTAITQTGVLYRLSLLAITYMRGGFIGESLALASGGQIMGPAVPNAVSRIIIIAPMLRELVGALGYAMKSKAAAGLAMAILVGFGQMSATTLTSSTTSVIVAAVLPANVRDDINWVSWTLYGAPYNLILFIGMLGTIFWLYRPSADDRSAPAERMQSLALQRALLGVMSRDEKIALLVGIALLAGFVLQPLHHIDPGWIALLAVGALSATRIVRLDTLRGVNWNFALLFGVLISLATVFGRTGLDRGLTNLFAGMTGDLGSSRVAFVVALSFLCFGISLVIRWSAAAPLITIALAPIASQAGIHPFVVGLIATVACNGFFLPYQSMTLLALDSGTNKELFTHAQIRPAAIAFGVWAVIAAVLSVPAWRMMGLM